MRVGGCRVRLTGWRGEGRGEGMSRWMVEGVDVRKPAHFKGYPNV